MFDTIPFLSFGNVTVAVITLMVIVGALALVYEIGIRLVIFCLAFDSEHAPKIKFKNIFVNTINKSITKIFTTKLCDTIINLGYS